MSVQMALILLALVCFVIDAVGVNARINLQSIGLALLTLTLLV